MITARAIEAMERFDGGLTADIQPTCRQEVQATLKEYYGIEGELQSYGAERDEIFGVTAPRGERCVLKIHSPAELPELADLRLRAMQHIAAHDPSIPVPHIIPSGSGDGIRVAFADGTKRIVHLMTHVAGIAQSKVKPSRPQARNVGQMLARVTRVLTDFHHSSARRDLVWDIANAADLIPVVPDPAVGRWQFVHDVLAHFAEAVRPRLQGLRAQVVHNDFNAHNLFVDHDDHAAVVGVIDFGDICHTQIVNDLAIAACYQLRFDENDVLAGMDDVVAGYCAVSPLEDGELDVLFDLILVRLAIAVTITEWRARVMPARALAILKNTPYAWKALERLRKISSSDAAKALRAACL